MAVIEETDWEECFIESTRDRRLEAELLRDFGQVLPGTSYFSECPWIPRAGLSLIPSGNLVHADPVLAEQISLVVSQDNSCRYCFAAHRVLLRMIGMSEQRLRRLEQDLLPADVDPRERLALDFARRVSRSNPGPSLDDVKELREAGYTDGAIVEMAVLAAYMVALNRLATFPALPPQFWEQLPDRWYIRMLRPLVGRILRRRLYRPAPVGLGPPAPGGPFSELVAALGELQVAHALRSVIDEAWGSQILPGRTKALVVAVVARGLGCEHSEREAARLLAEEGFPEEELGPVVEHLASPRLDRIERVAVPFARETIWYRSAQIQRRARAVREQLSGPEFLELVGIASFANMFCRLGIVIDLA